MPIGRTATTLLGVSLHRLGRGTCVVHVLRGLQLGGYGLDHRTASADVDHESPAVQEPAVRRSS